MGSEYSFALAAGALLHAPQLTAPAPCCVPLQTFDDMREVAYLAIDLAAIDRPEEVLLKVCRWLRHPSRAAACQLPGPLPDRE
jgi:hypothetical protein